ncbi:FadR/GntR family transcriptional regulator [Paraburkholderia unamae]|uniref:GntR family transcriptional regulator n=1 Tax=Paraburkholderia unamae TaxID=219649 RepID=A0ABX5KFH5_9BURK|nr:FadR/GntR family transcriptional regulator [Paraburkholderia unamae]PVX77132.1 GntR family transcriptional regulator [Paraburkholderia unamae]
MNNPTSTPSRTVAFEAPNITSAGTLADRVTAVLLEKITSGDFPPGARLPTEQVICERFGVSRTVVREAISRLKSEGLVEVRQGSGMVVREASRAATFRLPVEVNDSVEAVLRVTELRRGIEAEAAALAAERRTRTQLAEIKRALAAIDTAAKQQRDGVEEDQAFHMAISHATGNSLYPPMLEYLGQFVRAAILLTRTNEARRGDFSEQVRAEHKAIYDAIAAQDPVAARQAVITHIDNAGARIQVAGPAFWAGEGSTAAQPLLEEGKRVARKRTPR